MALQFEPVEKVFARFDDQMTFQLGMRIATQLITQQGKLSGFPGVKRHPKLECGDGHLFQSELRQLHDIDIVQTLQQQNHIGPLGDMHVANGQQVVVCGEQAICTGIAHFPAILVARDLDAVRFVDGGGN